VWAEAGVIIPGSLLSLGYHAEVIPLNIANLLDCLPFPTNFRIFVPFSCITTFLGQLLSLGYHAEVNSPLRFTFYH
jgi:hypothetical protein